MCCWPFVPLSKVRKLFFEQNETRAHTTASTMLCARGYRVLSSAPMSLESLPHDVLFNIACRLDGRSAARTSCACKWLQQLVNDKLWHQLCTRQGWKQMGVTRTRGRRPWRDVYAMHLCQECSGISPRGNVVFDLAGGMGIGYMSSCLVTLCADCVEQVQSCRTWAERRHCLPGRCSAALLSWGCLPGRCVLLHHQLQHGHVVVITCPTSRCTPTYNAMHH